MYSTPKPQGRGHKTSTTRSNQFAVSKTAAIGQHLSQKILCFETSLYKLMIIKFGMPRIQHLAHGSLCSHFLAGAVVLALLGLTFALAWDRVLPWAAEVNWYNCGVILQVPSCIAELVDLYSSWAISFLIRPLLIRCLILNSSLPLTNISIRCKELNEPIRWSI